MPLFDPNPLVLEAQSRVCTGPTQSRPLGNKSSDPQPQPVLDAILNTLQNKAHHPVSDIQMGSFFAAMRLRRNYPPKTAWSQAEINTFEQYTPLLQTHLPPDLQYIFGLKDHCPAESPDEQTVIASLKTILAGGHLTYDQTRLMCEAILTDSVRGSFKGAALIGQRMNLESYDEVRGYLHSTFAPERAHAVQVNNLTHFGQPYNGSTRYFKPTLFVAVLRAALGRPTVLHGVDAMPPKWGVTDELILNALNARTNLSLSEAAERLENPEIGFAYISQREYAPAAYAARDLRAHIGKRPPWSATEKAQQLFTCSGSNHIVIGYYHSGYEIPLLKIARETGFTSAVAIKGEEGTSHFSLRLGKPTDKTRNAINFSQGFRAHQTYACDINPATYGFHYTQNPRPNTVDAQTFAELGLAALSGEKGPVYDRIVLNAALTDYLLGFTADPHDAIQQTREAMDNGRALKHLRAYLSHT
ncbi:MAG: hypothetical protein OXI59_01200 [Gemmatimonadota bacterium]|nr:hypothetical protein [Gemmatimonadota bacterium]